MKKEIAKILDMDERTVFPILKNEELCNRILTENPIRYVDYIKTSILSPSSVKRLINKGIISSFRTAPTKGQIFIFPKELEKHEAGLLAYKPSEYWSKIESITELFISIFRDEEFDAHRNIHAILSEYLFSDANIEDVSDGLNLTRERVRQIINKAKRKVLINKYRFKTVEALEYSLSNIRREIDLCEIKKKQLHNSLKIKDNEPLLKILTVRQFEFVKKKTTELDLSVRAYNCLKAADIHSIEELLKFNVDELLKFRNFGKKSLNELENLLGEYNLSFGCLK